MKAILIDPFTREVGAVVIPNPDHASSFDSLKNLIQADWLTVFHVPHSDVMLYLDDNGLMKDPTEQAYWKFKGFGQSHFAGRALLVGAVGGLGTVDAFFTAEQVLSTIEWVEPPDEETLADLLTPIITTF